MSRISRFSHQETCKSPFKPSYCVCKVKKIISKIVKKKKKIFPELGGGKSRRWSSLDFWRGRKKRLICFALIYYSNLYKLFTFIIYEKKKQKKNEISAKFLASTFGNELFFKWTRFFQSFFLQRVSYRSSSYHSICVTIPSNSDDCVEKSNWYGVLLCWLFWG